MHYDNRFLWSETLTEVVQVVEQCDSSVLPDNGRFGGSIFSSFIQMIQTRSIVCLKKNQVVTFFETFA